MKRVFLLALPVLLLAAPVSDAEAARPRCKPGQKLLVSKGTCVSNAAFRAQIREARRETRREAPRREAPKAKPEKASNKTRFAAVEEKARVAPVVCTTPACVAQMEKAMPAVVPDPAVTSAVPVVLPIVRPGRIEPAVAEADPEVVICETEACEEEQDRESVAERKQLDEMLMREALQALREKMPR